MTPPPSLEEHFYGVATVGERGQVVIPAEARKKFDISPGDKVLVFGDPFGHGIVLTKIDHMHECMTRLRQSLEFLQQQMAAADSVEEE